MHWSWNLAKSLFYTKAVTMKINLKPSAKLKNKISIIYTVSSIVAVLVLGTFAFFYFNMGIDHPSTAATQAGPEIRSVRSGNWNTASTWGGTVPANGVAIIEEGHTVTVTTNANFGGDLLLHGTLEVHAGRTLRFTAENAKFAITATGVIERVRHWGGLFDDALFVINGATHILDWLWSSTISGPTGYGDGYVTLPIELLAFNATLNAEQDTEITWATASEENNEYFTIERSLDGKNFFTLDTIAGAGNSKEQLEYSYVDDAPVAGYNYYRLKQTDIDGKSETFDIVSVFNDNAAPELNIVSLGPNPYRDYFEINFTSIDDSPVHLKISDMNGRTIFRKTLEAEKGDNTFTYVDRKNLQPGIYLFTIVQRGTPAKTFRLVKDS